MSSFRTLPLRDRIFALATICLGGIGLLGSFELATEYLHKLKDSSYVPNCDISLLVTCGPNMESWQGSLFGFSNTFIGLSAFTIVVTVGFALCAGAKFSGWFWWFYNLGMLAGVTFVFWLSIQSVFVLGTLCPWCMVIWTAQIALFWLTVSYSTATGRAPLPKPVRRLGSFLSDWWWVLTLVSYATIAAYAQIALDWVGKIF